MTDAYCCERCSEYHGGSGEQVRVGRSRGVSGFRETYGWKLKAELCPDCTEELYAAVDEVMSDA